MKLVLASILYKFKFQMVPLEPISFIFSFFPLRYWVVLGRLRVKKLKLRVTRKTRDPHTKMNGFLRAKTRKNAFKGFYA